MTMNRVQFQAGFSMAEFMSCYGSDEQCEAALVCDALAAHSSRAHRNEATRQNGRVERLFGTIKPWLRWLLTAPNSYAETQHMLDVAKLVYNEHRPHQALGGLTPIQVWCGMNWDDVARENQLRRSHADDRIDERWRW